VRPSPHLLATGIAVNGGCNLASKCKGMGDYLAEQIQMGLPNDATITANWLPRMDSNHQTFTATFAGYQALDGDYIRFDNAHERDILHLDSKYKGRMQQHAESLSMPRLQIINRRRVALIELLRVLEQNIDWRIPVWFYMPWCMWWEQDLDFPNKLQRQKPPKLPIAEFCEAVMAYVSMTSDIPFVSCQPRGLAKVTADVIEEAADRVAYDLEKSGQFEYQTIVFGHTTILPFLMYAPPGATIKGPPDIIGLLIN